MASSEHSDPSNKHDNQHDDRHAAPEVERPLTRLEAASPRLRGLSYSEAKQRLAPTHQAEQAKASPQSIQTQSLGAIRSMIADADLEAAIDALQHLTAADQSKQKLQRRVTGLASDRHRLQRQLTAGLLSEENILLKRARLARQALNITASLDTKETLDPALFELIQDRESITESLRELLRSGQTAEVFHLLIAYLEGSEHVPLLSDCMELATRYWRLYEQILLGVVSDQHAQASMENIRSALLDSLSEMDEAEGIHEEQRLAPLSPITLRRAELLKDRVIYGELSQVLSALNAQPSSDAPSSFRDALILLSGRQHDLKAQVNAGVISKKDELFRRHQLRAGLFELINEVAKTSHRVSQNTSHRAPQNKDTPNTTPESSLISQLRRSLAKDQPLEVATELAEWSTQSGDLDAGDHARLIAARCYDVSSQASRGLISPRAQDLLVQQLREQLASAIDDLEEDSAPQKRSAKQQAPEKDPAAAIRQLVKKDALGAALKRLQQYFDIQKDPRRLRDTLLLSARREGLLRDHSSGLLSAENIDVALCQIRWSLLQMASQLTPSQAKLPSEEIQTQLPGEIQSQLQGEIQSQLQGEEIQTGLEVLEKLFVKARDDDNLNMILLLMARLRYWRDQAARQGLDEALILAHLSRIRITASQLLDRVLKKSS